MKALSAVALVVVLASAGNAFERRYNPDRFPSLGMDLSKGKLAGMLKDTAAGAPHTDGGFVKFDLDYKYPLNDVITLRAFGALTGINNNLQFSEGNQMGVGMRIYFAD